jgi:hypothetical protein
MGTRILRMLCISLTHASITGAIDAAGTVQTICIGVNGCSSRPCWAPLCHPYGVFFLRVAFSHRFRSGLRCFVPSGLSEKSSRFTAEVAPSGWRPSEVKWNRIPNFRISMLCHETRRWTPEKQPQPLLETPKIVRRLMNGDRFCWRTGTGSLCSPCPLC